jgi:hypothetical protein
MAMECFDAAFTMDSVVARRGGKFLIKAIFYPEYLNKIAVELAQHLRQIVFRRRDQLRALFDQLSSFFLQRGYLLLLIFDRWMISFSLELPDSPEELASIRYSVFNSSMSEPICKDSATTR